MKRENLSSAQFRSIDLQDLTEFLDRWKPYKFLWKNERSMRELLQISLSEFETTLRKHSELEDRLATEPDMIIFGTSIAVSTEKLKYGLYTEIKGECLLLLQDQVRLNSTSSSQAAHTRSAKR